MTRRARAAVALVAFVTSLLSAWTASAQQDPRLVWQTLETPHFRIHHYQEMDAVAQRVAEIAANHAVPRAQIALAWLLQKSPVTAPIIGATRIHHLEDAAGALAVQLTPEEVTYLEEPYVPHAVVGHQ